MNLLNYQFELLFALGVIAQFVFTVGRKFEREDITKLVMDIVLVLFGGLYLYLKTNEDIKAVLLLSTLFFVTLCALSFREKILPEINEIVLVVWNVGFWYLYITRFGFFNYLSLVLLAPTYLSLVVGVFKVTLNNFTKILLYVWFMIMAVGIALTFLPVKELINSEPIPPMSGTQAFLLGMMVFYTFTYLLYIVYFIPIPGKHQSFAVRLANIKEHAGVIVSKLNSVQYHPLLMLMILAVTSLAVYVNFTYHFISEGLLLTFLLGFSPLIGEKIDKILNLKQENQT